MPPPNDGTPGWLSPCGRLQRGRCGLPGFDLGGEALSPDLLSTQQTGNNMPLQQQQDVEHGPIAPYDGYSPSPWERALGGSRVAGVEAPSA
jgi:hypothetical protein